MDGKRRISKEPRKECHLLQVIGKAVWHYNARRFCTGERVSDFKVVLASRDLPRVSPGWRGVGYVGIVYPLTNLMGRDCRVVRRRHEEATDIEVERRVSLESQRSRRINGVVTAGTAVVDIGRIADRHSRVVDHKHGERARVNSLHVG